MAAEMLSETLNFYLLTIMLLGSVFWVIFAPRMFLALFALFLTFLFSGLLCLTLDADFAAMLMFVFGCFVLCPVIFVLMNKINRATLELKLAKPSKIVVSFAIATVFGFLACLYVNEEFKNSLFNIFNFVKEKSHDIVSLEPYIFPLHIVIILAVVSILAIRAILVTSDIKKENCDE